MVVAERFATLYKIDAVLQRLGWRRSGRDGGLVNDTKPADHESTLPAGTLGGLAEAVPL